MPRQELYKVKSFPTRSAGSRLPEPTSQPICTRQLELCSWRRASAGAPGSQIITLKSPHTLAFAGDPRLHQALPSWSSSPSAPAQDEPATRPPPPQCPPRALPDWSRGQKRSAFGGSQAEEGSREEENGRGRRGTGREIPNPQPRSQRSLPGAAPALVSAPCCRRRRYCSPPGCSQLPITADADAQPSPSLVAPSRFSLAVSSSQTASEKGEGERSLGVPADSRSRNAARGGEGAGGEGVVGEARRAGGRSRRRAWKLD